MLDYFKNMRLRKAESAPPEQPKKDKVFIAVLIIMAVMFIAGLIFGTSGGEESQTFAYGFSFSLSDGIILAVIAAAYIFVRVKKGHNE